MSPTLIRVLLAIVGVLPFLIFLSVLTNWRNVVLALFIVGGLALTAWAVAELIIGDTYK